MEERFNINQLNEIRGYISPYLRSKLEEFWHLGIERITMDELWTFVIQTMKKKKLTDFQLHELVNFIMRLSVNDYLNKIRLEMFKEMDLEVFREQS